MNNDINLDALLSLTPAVHAPSAPTPTPTPLTSVQRIEGATPGCFALVIPDTVYHANCPGASSSSLKQMLRSPAHYQAYLQGPNLDSEARRVGRATHALLLERTTFLDHFVVWKDGRRAGKKFDEFEREHAGKTILNENEHMRAMEAALALRQNQDFPLGLWLDGVRATATSDAVPAARTEFSIFWQERLGDGDDAPVVQCKARIDAHGMTPSPLALDVKTTDDARLSAFRHQFKRLHYDLQAAHYRAALRAFYGIEFPFLFAVVESEAPYASKIYGTSARVLANGEEKRQYALRTLAQCQATNQWPAYARTGIEEIDLEFMERFDAAA